MAFGNLQPKHGCSERYMTPKSLANGLAALPGTTRGLKATCCFSFLFLLSISRSLFLSARLFMSICIYLVPPTTLALYNSHLTCVSPPPPHCALCAIKKQGKKHLYGDNRRERPPNASS